MKLAPELALALECTRIRLDDAAKNRIRSFIHHGVDWGAFLQFAIPHGILPFAARTLRLCAADLTPDTTLVQLEAVLGRTRLRYTRQCQALVEMMHTLERAGVRALAYKGPALIATAYSDPGLREFHDLDLWTAPGELVAAGKVLQSLGYRPSSYQEGSARECADKGARQNMFVSLDGQVIVDLLDLELAPQYYFRPGFEELWERRCVVDLGGDCVETLSLEDLLPALSVHGSKHYWRRLNWAVDLAALLTRNSRVHWEAVLERSTRWRCKRRVLGAMVMQADLYGGSLQPEIAKATAPYPKLAAASRQATRQLFLPADRFPSPNATSVFFYHYHSTDLTEDRTHLALTELLRRSRRMAGRCKRALLHKREHMPKG